MSFLQMSRFLEAQNQTETRKPSKKFLSPFSLKRGEGGKHPNFNQDLE